MITSLTIKNYALIEEINVTLNSGMTVITGETGAGKSILLGALSLLLGKRADLSSIKDTTKKSTIEAQFAIETYNLQSIFTENDLDYEPQTIVRRELLPGGKSRAFINDTPVTLTQMQELGAHLVDIHSQNETLTLTSEKYQFETIDTLAENTELLKEYSKTFKEYKLLSEELESLKITKAEAAKELDYNTFLLNELSDVSLENINQAGLEESFRTLNNAEEISTTFASINRLLIQEQLGTLDSIKEMRSLLNNIRSYTSSYDELWERINSIVLELEDIEQTIDVEAGRVEADPKELLNINETLQSLYNLQQKHNLATVDELITLKASLTAKIDDTLNLDEVLEQKANQLEEIKNELKVIASHLHAKRLDTIPKLETQLKAFLTELGIPNAQFKFNLSLTETFKKNGLDTMDVLFSANVGSDLGPLKKVASGGEMSRIMLAVKAVLSRYKKLPTIIFDEIDTGVSGEVALKISEIMSQMGAEMQLMSITHLPQIAAKGEHHIKIYKEETSTSTATHLTKLNEDERIVEIAQMIGGNQITDTTLANAKELLN